MCLVTFERSSFGGLNMIREPRNINNATCRIHVYIVFNFYYSWKTKRVKKYSIPFNPNFFYIDLFFVTCTYIDNENKISFSLKVEREIKKVEPSSTELDLLTIKQGGHFECNNIFIGKRTFKRIKYFSFETSTSVRYPLTEILHHLKEINAMRKIAA